MLSAPSTGRPLQRIVMGGLNNSRGYIRGFLQNGSKLLGCGQMENVIPLVVGLAPANTPATDASLEQLVEQSRHGLYDSCCISLYVQLTSSKPCGDF